MFGILVVANAINIFLCASSQIAFQRQSLCSFLLMLHPNFQGQLSAQGINTKLIVERLFFVSR